MTTIINQAMLFLSRVLPQKTDNSLYYAVGHVRPNVNWQDEVHRDFESMVTRSMTMSDGGYNTYFGLSAFGQSWHYPTPNKMQFRVQTNAVLQKCLWLDIDVDKHKSPYKTAAEAVSALLIFMQHVKLPAPMIVSSGIGLHIYWTFKETIPTEQWLVLARMLKALTVHFNLIVDHSRTTDASSVLRMPGTLNYGKDGVARPVTIQVLGEDYHVVDIAGKLLDAIKTNHVTIAPAKKTTLPVAPPSAPNMPAPPTGLQFDIATDGPLRHPLNIIKGCKQIQQSGIGTYTQWYNMMLVMKHCAFGERAIHDISRMDKDRYDEYNVNEKYRQAVAGGYGPARCITFDEKDPGICKTCPWWGKIGSPLLLGDIYQENKPIIMPAAEIDTNVSVSIVMDNTATMEVVPFSTKDYSVVPDQGVIWHKRELIAGSESEEDGSYAVKNILISNTEIYIHSICIDSTDGEVKRSYVIRKKAPNKIAEDIMFEIDTALGSHQLIKWLAQHGMLPIKPKYNKAMSDFMSTYLAAVQNRLPEILIRDHFGWVKDYNKLTGEQTSGFIVGKTMHTDKGTKSVRLNERATNVARPLIQSGTLEQWKNVPKMYQILNQPYAMLMMCGGFAAPFMQFGTGTATNLAFNLWDVKGGKGKSNVLKAISSIWGNPEELLLGRSDTLSSRYQYFSVMKNLPICIDEITQMNSENAADMLYDIVNGKERKKSLATGTDLAKTGSWKTLTFMTSNRSLYEMMSQYRQQSTATAMRVVEMRCDFEDYSGTEYARYINDVLGLFKTTYGVAGPAFMEYCFKHPELFKEVPARAAKWALDNTIKSDERFWLYGIGISLAVGQIVNDMGIWSYDIPKLTEWCEQVLIPTIRGKVAITESTGNQIIVNFFNEHLRNTLTVACAHRPSNMQETSNSMGLDAYVKSAPVDKLYIRKEQDTRTIYVNSDYLRKWHTQNNLSMDATLETLVKSGVYEPGSKRREYLGRGVKILDVGQVMAYKFNGLKLWDLIPE